MENEISYIGVFLLTGVLFVVVNLGISALLRPFHPTPKKIASYECGEEPIGDAWVQYNVRYYLFAMFFVIFDVEAIFLIPWALVFKALGSFAFWEMLVFLFLLIVALVHVWRKGGLKWA